MNIEFKGRLTCACCANNCHPASHHDESHIRSMHCLCESLGGSEELVLLKGHQMENTQTQVDTSILQQVLQEINRPFKMN